MDASTSQGAKRLSRATSGYIPLKVRRVSEVNNDFNHHQNDPDKMKFFKEVLSEVYTQYKRAEFCDLILMCTGDSVR